MSFFVCFNLQDVAHRLKISGRSEVAAQLEYLKQTQQLHEQQQQQQQQQQMMNGHSSKVI